MPQSDMRATPHSVVPFGPQHPVLPEPLHLKLVLENEKVVEALPGLGYVHRGLETLCSVRDFNQMVYVVERVCGICSCIHALCYCHCLEKLMGLDVPVRAKYLRIIWSELHRIHSHLLWLGLFADAFGYESLFMAFWKIREKIMDINEATAGNRVIISVNVVGGVRRDLDAAQCRWIDRQLADVRKEIETLQAVILNDPTVLKRTKGIGVLGMDEAWKLGAVGPTARGSGIREDMRLLKYDAFEWLDFEPVVETDGDSYARSKVRFREVLQSIDLIRQAIAMMPEGELAVRAKGNPQGEVQDRVEQPRGGMMYYVKADGSKFLSRVRIRTPTFANIMPLLPMLPGCELADVPVIVLSIDPCISCTER